MHKITKKNNTITLSNSWQYGTYYDGVGYVVFLYYNEIDYNVYANITKVEVFSNGWYELTFKWLSRNSLQPWMLVCSPKDDTDRGVLGYSYLFRLNGTVQIVQK